MNFYHGYYMAGMRNLDGCKRWQECIVTFREGNSEKLSAKYMLDNCVDADVFSVISLDMFTDAEAEKELLQAVKEYNSESKKNNICYRYRLANENEMKELQTEHKDKILLLALVRYDIYGRWNWQDEEYYKSKNKK